MSPFTFKRCQSHSIYVCEVCQTHCTVIFQSKQYRSKERSRSSGQFDFIVEFLPIGLSIYIFPFICNIRTNILLSCLLYELEMDFVCNKWRCHTSITFGISTPHFSLGFYCYYFLFLSPNTLNALFILLVSRLVWRNILCHLIYFAFIF